MIIEQFSTKFQIKFSTELRNALGNLFGLRPQVRVIIKPNFKHLFCPSKKYLHKNKKKKDSRLCEDVDLMEMPAGVFPALDAGWVQKAPNSHFGFSRSDDRIDHFVATALHRLLILVHQGVGSFKNNGNVLVVSRVEHRNSASQRNLIFSGTFIYFFDKVLLQFFTIFIIGAEKNYNKLIAAHAQIHHTHSCS